ncbi:MAG: hypothetical protein K0S65_5718, partial [Labilithrix sp.]|nr:hypothetical protein [Labilithrix sp.]
MTYFKGRIGPVTFLPFAVMTASILPGCGDDSHGDTKTVYRDRIVNLDGSTESVSYVDDLSG